MKSSEPNELLKEILGGDELSDLRRATLQQGLAAMKQRRRTRQILRAGAVAILPVALLLAVVLRPSVNKSVPTLSTSAPSTEIAAAPVRAPEIKIITDEELLAL